MEPHTFYLEYQQVLQWCQSALKNSAENTLFADPVTCKFFLQFTPQKKIAPTKKTPPIKIERTKIEPTKTSPPPSEEIPKEVPKIERPLTPSPWKNTLTNTEQLRRSIESIEGMPRLSSEPMYRSIHSKKPPQIALCTFFSANETASRSILTQNISSALQSKLQIQTTLYSCHDTHFSKIAPFLFDDSDTVLFFIDPHVDTSFKTLLSTISEYSPISKTHNPPFISYGSIKEKNILVCILEKDAPQNSAFKKNLWDTLKTMTVHCVR